MPPRPPRPTTDDPWRDAHGTPIALRCRVEQIAIDPAHGALPSRLHQQGQVIGRGTGLLYVIFDHDQQPATPPPARPEHTRQTLMPTAAPRPQGQSTPRLSPHTLSWLDDHPRGHGLDQLSVADLDNHHGYLPIRGLSACNTAAAAALRAALSASPIVFAVNVCEPSEPFSGESVSIRLAVSSRA